MYEKTIIFLSLMRLFVALSFGDFINSVGLIFGISDILLAHRF